MDPKSKQNSHSPADLSSADDRRDSRRVKVQLPMRFLVCEPAPEQPARPCWFVQAKQQSTARSLARIDDELQYVMGEIDDPATRQVLDLLSQKVERLAQSSFYQTPDTSVTLELSMASCAFEYAEKLNTGQACAMQMVLPNGFQVIANGTVIACRANPDETFWLVVGYTHLQPLHRRQYQRFVLNHPNPRSRE